MYILQLYVGADSLSLPNRLERRVNDTRLVGATICDDNSTMSASSPLGRRGTSSDDICMLFEQL